MALIEKNIPGVVALHDSELFSFIESIYHEPYSFLKNNCIHKSLRIREKAKEWGKQVDIILCIAIVRMKCLHGFPLLCPHLYTRIDGITVDVTLDPVHEARYCRNEGKGMLFPVKISSIGRHINPKVELVISPKTFHHIRGMMNNGY